MENMYYPFVNTPLPYDYSAMEPYIDEKTMRLHHDRHLQSYIDGLNAALADCPSLQSLSLVQLIQASVRLAGTYHDKILNNAGGVFNHRLFFDGLANPADKPPQGELLKAIERSFGSYEGFCTEFKRAAMSVFGSGYAWLICGRSRLKITTSQNQDSPVRRGYRPLLCIDVWEHAYYLKHYNMRADYTDDWLSIINWDEAGRRFADCTQPCE